MLIRIGYDIELAVATPMALIYLLRVHPSRRDDLRRARERCRSAAASSPRSTSTASATIAAASTCRSAWRRCASPTTP